MKTIKAFASCVLVGLAGAVLLHAYSEQALRGFQGVEVGMEKSQVIDCLEARGHNPHISNYADGLSTSVRDSRFFRHAHYRFSDEGKVTEIALTMREVLGSSRILQDLNKIYRLGLSQDSIVVRDGVAISVNGNNLVIRDAGLTIATSQPPAQTSSK